MPPVDIALRNRPAFLNQYRGNAKHRDVTPHDDVPRAPIPMPTPLIGTLRHARKTSQPRSQRSSAAEKHTISLDQVIARPVHHQCFCLWRGRKERGIHSWAVGTRLERP
jgi:hypothetical protein